MKKIKRKLYLAIICFITLILLGTITYSSIEKWTFLDSLYFTVITSTTIGYGDLYPTTNIGKIFTIVFSFLGISMAFYFFTLFSKYVYKKTFKEEIKEHLKKR